MAQPRPPQAHSARAALAAVAALVAVLYSPMVRAEGGIAVSMNQAKLVKLARPIDTVVIGNAEIVDASVQDAYTIVLTGKGFGVTNVVVLDDRGVAIADEQVTVSRQDANSLRIYRRAEVQTLSCTPYCESAFMSDAEKTSDASAGVAQ